MRSLHPKTRGARISAAKRLAQSVLGIRAVPALHPLCARALRPPCIRSASAMYPPCIRSAPAPRLSAAGVPLHSVDQLSRQVYQRQPRAGQMLQQRRREGAVPRHRRGCVLRVGVWGSGLQQVQGLGSGAVPGHRCRCGLRPQHSRSAALHKVLWLLCMRVPDSCFPDMKFPDRTSDEPSKDSSRPKPPKHVLLSRSPRFKRVRGRFRRLCVGRFAIRNTEALH